jgi:hypothetical protein
MELAPSSARLLAGKTAALRDRSLRVVFAKFGIGRLPDLVERIKTGGVALIQIWTKEPAMPRELISPRPGDKRYVRRKKGKFTRSQDDVGRSLAADRRKKAKKVAKKGEGDRGDQKPRKRKSGSRKKSSILSRLFGG